MGSLDDEKKQEIFAGLWWRESPGKGQGKGIQGEKRCL